MLSNEVEHEILSRIGRFVKDHKTRIISTARKILPKDEMVTLRSCFGKLFIDHAGDENDLLLIVALL